MPVTTPYTYLRSPVVYSLLFILLIIVDVRAEPYIPQNTLHIETESQTISSNEGHTTKTYQIETSYGNAQQKQVTFYQADKNPRWLCRFSFLIDGSKTWQRNMGGKTQTISPIIFLRPGFPIPVDILPIALQDQPEKSYEIKTQSGGRTFVKSYRVTIEEISYDTAVERGWLKGNVIPSTTLQLFTVFDKTKHIISIQLWPANGSWWVYEETPFRKSWLIKGL